MSSGITFYLFDSETNGLKAFWHEITEVCVIRDHDRLSLSRNVRIAHPERSDSRALAITGKTVEEIMKGDSSEDVINAFEEFLNMDGVTPAHRCFIAHNANFDLKHLHALWAKHNRKFPADLWLCTMQMARAALKKRGIVKPKVNLEATAEAFGTKRVEGQHNAISDARNLWFIWHQLQKEIDYLPFIKTIPHSLGGSTTDTTGEYDSD